MCYLQLSDLPSDLIPPRTQVTVDLGCRHVCITLVETLVCDIVACYNVLTLLSVQKFIFPQLSILTQAHSRRWSASDTFSAGVGDINDITIFQDNLLKFRTIYKKRLNNILWLFAACRCCSSIPKCK